LEREFARCGNAKSLALALSEPGFQKGGQPRAVAGSGNPIPGKMLGLVAQHAGTRGGPRYDRLEVIEVLHFGTSTRDILNRDIAELMGAVDFPNP
jgi:hypothetical protein